jgi:hypothetical protein
VKGKERRKTGDGRREKEKLRAIPAPLRFGDFEVRGGRGFLSVRAEKVVFVFFMSYIIRALGF